MSAMHPLRLLFTIGGKKPEACHAKLAPQKRDTKIGHTNINFQ
jgi:hypothetical protein